jgi:hypothetical protein
MEGKDNVHRCNSCILSWNYQHHLVWREDVTYCVVVVCCCDVLCYTHRYVNGAMALGSSYLNSGGKMALVVLVTSEVSSAHVKLLATMWQVTVVDPVVCNHKLGPGVSATVIISSLILPLRQYLCTEPKARVINSNCHSIFPHLDQFNRRMIWMERLIKQVWIIISVIYLILRSYSLLNDWMAEWLMTFARHCTLEAHMHKVQNLGVDSVYQSCIHGQWYAGRQSHRPCPV